MSDAMDSSDPDDILELARWLHEEYKHHASEVGWETQEGTSTEFSELPDDNKSVMVRTASALLYQYNIERRSND